MSTKDVLLSEIEEGPEPLPSEVLDFVHFLKAKAVRERLDIAIMSDSPLGKEWLKPEENEAWRDLRRGMWSSVILNTFATLIVNSVKDLAHLRRATSHFPARYEILRPDPDRSVRMTRDIAVSSGHSLPISHPSNPRAADSNGFSGNDKTRT